MSNAKKPGEHNAAEGPSQVNTRLEEKKVEERVAIGPHVVYETIRREGEQELQRPSSALAWSGFAAGLSMGFSLVAEGLLAAHLPDASWVPLVSRLGYSVGFLIVTLGRQQLFTETTLTVVLPFLARGKPRLIWSVLRIWGVILGANLAGAFLFALCIARLAIFDLHVQEVLLRVSQERLEPRIAVVFVRAIFAGWLIALMVWLMPAAESARVSIIVIVTYLIGLAGFNHIIAGSNKMFFLIASGHESWGAYFFQFFLPTLAGNVVGGVSLVAFLGHAQVVSGKNT
jgi:formate-nitrite transporter family protein